jgi:hypothetical protein
MTFYVNRWKTFPYPQETAIEVNYRVYPNRLTNIADQDKNYLKLFLK